MALTHINVLTDPRPTVCYCDPGKCSAPKPSWCIGNRACDQPAVKAADGEASGQPISAEKFNELTASVHQLLAASHATLGAVKTEVQLQIARVSGSKMSNDYGYGVVDGNLDGLRWVIRELEKRQADLMTAMQAGKV